GIDNYSYAVCDGYSVDPGNVGVSVDRAGPDPDRTRLVCNARIADIDIVIAREEIFAGCIAHSNVAAPIVVKERVNTDGRVVEAGCVVIERVVTDGRVFEAGCVIQKRSITIGCVKAA